jgi:hypothetical protein
MAKPHRLFPLGIWCAHCETWHALKEAIEHAERLHPDCASCRIEQMLSRDLLDEAVRSTVTVAERHRPLSVSHA